MFVMISYSRQELTFVDSLAGALEARGVETWVDYRRLVPGRPWQEQIYAGIDAADAVLLVVSKESVASKNVEKEWRYGLEKGKRVILIVFEAQPLAPELAGCEWVDFREGFSGAVERLLTLLRAAPAALPAAEPAPQTGFAMPPTPRLVYALSLVAAGLSIPTVIPALRLVPLPRQIRQRRYVLQQVILSLYAVPILLPLAVLLIGAAVDPIARVDFNTVTTIMAWGFGLALVVSVALLLLLRRSGGMYRWAGPGGVVVQTRPLAGRALREAQESIAPHLDRQKSVALVYAPADQGMIDALARELERAGHQVVAPADTASAEVKLVVLSHYQLDTALDAETDQVYPVVIDDCDTRKANPVLTRLQLIDLRRDAPARMKVLARLIADPPQLLRYLGSVPVRGVRRPAAVDTAVAFYLFLLLYYVLALVSLLLLLLLPPEAADLRSLAFVISAPFGQDLWSLAPVNMFIDILRPPPPLPLLPPQPLLLAAVLVGLTVYCGWMVGRLQARRATRWGWRLFVLVVTPWLTFSGCIVGFVFLPVFLFNRELDLWLLKAPPPAAPAEDSVAGVKPA